MGGEGRRGLTPDNLLSSYGMVFHTVTLRAGVGGGVAFGDLFSAYGGMRFSMV